MFDIRIHAETTSDPCDACHKPASADNPIIELYQQEGRGRLQTRNLINIHETCFAKRVAKERTRLVAPHWEKA